MKILSFRSSFLLILFSVVIPISRGTLSAQKPTIASFIPTSGPIGSTVSINGTNFSTTPADNIVWFGAVQATVNTATSSQLTVTVPSGATFQPVTVTVNGLTGWSGRPFLVTFQSTRQINATAFATKVDFPTGNDPQGAAIGDIDGDGKPDLIVTNSNSNTISVYRNTCISGSISAGSFAAKVNFITGMDPTGIAIGDVDGDGKQDLIVTNNSSGGAISIFRNTSTSGSISAGSLASRFDLPVGDSPNSVAIADIDGDGKPDLVITNFNSSTVSIFRNTSTTGSITVSSFAAKLDFPTELNLQKIAFGDIDGDGKPDMVVPNWYSNTVSVYRNTSTSGSITVSSFATKVDFPTGMNPNDIAIVDLDGDNKPEMIISNTNSNSVSIFRNITALGSISTASFDGRIDFITGSSPMGIDIGDIDGDGKPDLSVSNFNSNTVSVFRNVSTLGSITASSLADRVDFSTWTAPAVGKIGDIDGDGKPDIIVVNSNSNVVSVFQNTIPPPVPPVISSFVPTSGQIGSTVTISGSNFSTTLANNIVWFGAVQATVTAATSTSLSVTVPTGATYQPITVTVNGLTAYTSKPFIVTFPSSQIIDATGFAAKVDFSTGTNPYGVVTGDIDGDGKPDIVVTNNTSNTISVYRNMSSIGSLISDSFAAKVDFSAGDSPAGVAIGDIDGDGKPDLAVINKISNTVSIFKNTSTSGSITSGSFAAKIEFSTGNNPYNVAIGDIDYDGKPDLVVANRGSNTVSVLRNKSYPGSITSGSFSEKVDFATGINPNSVALGDIDGDGKQDVVVTNEGSNSVSVLKNTSASGSIFPGSLAGKVDLITESNPYCVVVGDVDGDGKPDLAVTNYPGNTVSLYRNNCILGSITEGSFNSRVDFFTSSMPFTVAMGNINGDSKPDLVVPASFSKHISLFRNISNPGIINLGSLVDAGFSTSGNPVSVAICDIDGDGKPDLVVTNSDSNTLSVFQNLITVPLPPTITSFTPTSGPIGTTVTISGTNFSTTASNNIVWFGAVQATVTVATSNSLSVTVPTGATYQPITVTVNGLTAYSGKSFNVTFQRTHLLDATAFSTKVDFAAGESPWSSAIADIDGDGKPDIAVANNNNNTVSVYRNTCNLGFVSPTSFASKIDFTTGTNPNRVAIGDIDGDGKPDLVVLNQNSNSVSVFRNTATPGSITTSSFAAKVDFSTGSSPYYIAIGDIDGDGKPDLAVTNWSSNTVSVFRNTTTSGSITSDSFDAKVDFIVGNYPSGVVIGDIDGDGKPDLVVNNVSSSAVSIFRNTATSGSITSGSFAAKIDFTAGPGPLDVALFDIDGDGKPDIVVNNNSNSNISIFRNISTSGSITAGSFESKVDFATEYNSFCLAIGDIDGDGKPDMVFGSHSNNTISLFKNTSNSGSVTSGSFATRVNIDAGGSASSIALCDFDGDGKSDLVFTNSYSNTVSVLRNTLADPVPPVITSFSPTFGPIGTALIISGSNFNTIPANNIIWFGAVRATITAATSATLTVTVPTGATYQRISVTDTTTGLSAYSGNPFNVTYTSSRVIDATVFAPKIDFGSLSAPESVVFGDIDSDGKPDLVVTNGTGNTVSVFRNVSSSGPISAGSFEAKFDFVTATAPRGVALGDLDGDGRLDLVIANSSGSISVYRNTSTSVSIGPGTFSGRIDFAAGDVPTEVAIGDIDRDGKPDLVITNWTSSTVSVFRNNCTSGTITSGSFSQRIDFPTGMNPVGIAIGDIDGDGKDDLTVANNGGSSISLFRNISSAGSFNTGSFEPRIDITARNPWGINIGDIDGDGKLDLLVTNNLLSSISILRNTSSSGTISPGSFASPVDFGTLNNPDQIAVGDIDGDGTPDIAVTNFGSAMVSVFKNTSTSGSITTGSLSGRVDFAVGTNPRGIAIFDIDGDNKPDIVAANSTNSTISVVRNIISETAPVPPVISSLTPTSGPTGAVVAIAGSNFSATATNNIVWFGAVKAEVTAASTTNLLVTVPKGATYQPITVTVNGLTAYSGSPFTVTFPSVGIFNTSCFATKVDFTTGSNPNYSAISDIDGDGKPDLVVSNAYNNSISVYRNTSMSGSVSSGTFRARVDFSTGTNPNGIAIGDIDGDGKPDIIVTNGTANNISVFRNTSTPDSIGPNSFAAKIDIAAAGFPQTVSLADIDGDGKTDIVVTNNEGLGVSIYRNMSTPGYISTSSFAPKVDFTTGTGPWHTSFAIGDIDGDGKPDLAVTNSYSGTVSIFRNTSTPGSIAPGSFAGKVDIATGANPWSVAIGDIDGDGKTDLTVTYLNSNKVSVFRNTNPSGSITLGSFAPMVDFTTGSQPYYTTIGDITGDGKPDLAVIYQNGNTVSIFRNTSTSGSINSGSFDTRIDFYAGGNSTCVALGDIDGDGKPDLVVTNGIPNTVSVLRNTIPETLPPPPPVINSFTPASGPIGTSVTISGTNFNTTAINNIVWFGAVKATVTAATSTSLSVTVPSGATYQPISVTDVTTGLTAYSSKPFNVTFPSSRIIDATSFAANVNFTTGTGPENVVIADIDDDGKPDLVVANFDGNTISVYRNTSTSGSVTAGSFSEKVDFITGGNPGNIAIGDIDGDGKPDLVVTGANNNLVSVLRNTSTPGSITAGSFATKVDFNAGIQPEGIAIGDIDGDGKPDLVIANFVSNIISVYRNTSSSGSISTGSFAAKVDFTTGNGPWHVVVGDIDGDGKLDIAVINWSSNTVSVFRNTSNSGSVSTSSLAARVDFTTGTNPWHVVIGDIDGDSKPDLAVANGNSNTVSVFRNTSSSGSITVGSFTSKIDLTIGKTQSCVVLGDIDGDGKPDLVVSNDGSMVSIFRNTCASGSITSASFAANVDLNVGANPRGVIICDIDGDGKPDIAVANYTNNTISVLRNTISADAPVPPTITSFAPASGSVGTTVTIQGTNFSTTPAENTVLFGTIQASVSSATSTQLTVIVPAEATTQLIYVTVNGLTANSGTFFTVTAPTSDPPVISSFNPTSGLIGSTVTINGSNFNANISNNIVKFGTIQAAVISATATQLSVIVPAGTTNQPIYVTVNGLTAYTSTSFMVSATPVIASFNPTSGPAGTTVTIQGTNFSTTPADNTVLFGTVQTSVSSATSTQLTVIVPAGATNQLIYVTVNGLTANSGTSFTVTASASDQPVISSFNPASGLIGSTVTITGLFFSAMATDNIVRFGTVPAAVISAATTQLSVLVPAGATNQPIYITVNNLTAFTSTSFNVVFPPIIASFNPTSGPVGTTLTIQGNNFGNTPADNIVLFGAISATVTVATATQLTVNVPVGAISNPIAVTVNGLTAISNASFTVTLPPTIMSFSPASGQIGTAVTINGSNFSTNISSNIVKFGTVQSAVISATPTQLTVIVPAGATTQSIYVTVNGLTTSTSASFIIIFPPVIISFNPGSGPIGTNVTITGSNFSNSTANNIVWFGVVQATVISATTSQLTVSVPIGATSSFISLTVNGLAVISNNPFNVTSTPPPVINSFTPTSGPVGTTVTINGNNFSTTAADNIVIFGNIQATVTASTPTQLTITIPAGVTSQPFMVTVNGLTVYSNNPFNVTTSGTGPNNNSFEFESPVLTLNGDGINDRLIIKNFEGYGKCSISVYNSRGVLIYSNKDYKNDWDLTINGRLLETGGYFYIAETDSGIYRGSFSILRPF